MIRTLAAVSLAFVLTSSGCTCWSEFHTTGKGGSGGTGGGGGSGGMGGAPFCVPGEKRACYTGPQGTEGQGICQAGEQTCNGDGAAFGACEGEQLPQPEDCVTPLDEDCDGVAPTCQAPCVWSKAFGDGEEQRVSAIAVDASGDVLAVGVFAGAVDFGAGVATSDEDADIFVTRLTADGLGVWTAVLPGEGVRTPTSMALDGDGAAIVTGLFSGSIDFTETSLSSGGGTSLFVVKLDTTDGSYIWGKAFGPAIFQDAASAVDGSGDVILAGGFLGSLNWGGGPMANESTDVFLAKLDGADGAHIWSKKIGAAGHQTVTAVAVDAEGDIVVSGGFSNAIDLGGGVLSSNGGFDGFLSRLAGNDGSHVWSRTLGDSANHPAHRLVADATGNIALAGTFNGSADLGGDLLVGGEGGINLFVARLQAEDGAHLWSKNCGTIGDYPFAIQADANGGVFLSGGFVGALDFAETPGSNTLASQGLDVFAARLSADGQHVWSKRFGAPDGQPTKQAATTLAIAPDGGLFLAGRFEAGLTLGCVPLVSAGQGDAFIAKFGP